VFPKYDGSNVRAEWSRKRGWYKFGRRNGLLDDSNPVLAAEAKPLMLDTYGDDLARIYRAQRWDRAIAFFEFFGPNSFAGSHEDEEHEVMLLDVSVHRKGLLEPRQFLKTLDGIKLPPVLHFGNFTADISAQVEAGEFPGQTFEGVIAKGAYKTPGRPLMFKRKNQAWLDKLRGECVCDAEFQRRA
jgi:hypothetical protein